jgi:hypothetical protein
MTSKQRDHSISIDASLLPRQRPPQQSLQRRAMQQTTTYLSTNLRYQQQQYIRRLYEFKVERNNGLPVSLSCTDTSNTSSTSNAKQEENDTRQVLDTTILFDYEITLRNSEEQLAEVLFQDLPKWEFFLLYYVAEDIGVVGCQHIGQQNITSSSSKSSVDVVKLSSFGPDVVDTRVGKCRLLKAIIHASMLPLLIF